MFLECDPEVRQSVTPFVSQRFGVIEVLARPGRIGHP